MKIIFKLKVFISVSFIILSLKVFADAKSFYFDKSLNPYSYSNFNFEKDNSTLEGFFRQRIDHNNPADQRRFEQRYYINSNYAQGQNAPVFFYICGESTCHKSRVERGQIINWAKEFGGHIVALEHRFYGKSIPLNSLKTENLRYLNIDLALKDIYYFQRYLREERKLVGDYVMIGGSYPGNLSAAYRNHYPEMTIGALSSSAPVFAKENFFEYDQHIAEVVDQQCLNNIHQVNQTIEGLLDDEEQLRLVKAKFQAEKIDDSIDFLYLIADVAAAAIQYGMKESFCKAINQEKPLEGYSDFARKLFKSWNISAVDLTFQSAYDENPDAYLENFGMRQWLYQSCTEYGYWQVANNYPLTARSSKINLIYHRQTCEKIFGLKYPVNTGSTNLKYYYPLFQHTTTNILFTNGSDDPWSKLSLNEDMNHLNENLDIKTIPFQAHCDDLRTPTDKDSIELQSTRQYFINLLKRWL